jgi:integrase
MKLTWKALSSATIADPAVHGEGYQLRYRRRAGGIFAELRFKVSPGKWTAYRLGQVPSEAETRAKLAAQMPPHTMPMFVSVDHALDPIRAKARELCAQLGQGNDPRGKHSLRALIDQYLKHRGPELRPRTLVETKRHLLKHWEPLHDRPAAQITRREIAARLLELPPVAGNRARATLRALCVWAIRRGLVERNPVDGTGKSAERSRERELSMEELRAIWTAAGDGDHGAIVKLLMLTGQRRGEVAGMLWSELDLDGALWSLPGSRTKNARPHVVPLSVQAVELLRGVERRPGRDHVFGEGEGYSGWSRSKARLDGRCGVADWRLHDLRHAWSTHVHELGVAPHVVEAAINHLSGFKAGVAGLYYKAQYMPERTRAMQLWADHLLQSEPAKVVRLRG